MKKYNVAILGATGAVGQEMLKVLIERNFPLNEIKLLASARSAGKTIKFADKDYTIEEACEDSFKGMDIVLGAATNETAIKFSKAIIASNAVFIDNSSAFRMDDECPLVVPEVNSQDCKNHKGIIANPNCATIIALTAINVLDEYANINRMIVSTYQAVSGAGVGGIYELDNQVAAISKNEDVNCDTFAYQIAYNLIPQIGGFDDMGYSSEEMKMQNEGRKILHKPELKVNCTCIRVPVYRSHSESITLEFDKEISVEKARELLANAKGVKLVDDLDNQQYPMPLDTTDQDLIYVGRIRKDISNDKNGLVLWCCGDQVRKGAATNAIQIGESLIEQGLI